MRRAAPFLLFSALMCMVAGSAGAQDTPSVLVAKVDGSIDRTLASYLVDSIEEAEREGSTLVLQLDSAGTLDEDAVALAERIHDASVPVIVWVGPSPAKAAGAGLLFLYAASLGAVAPGAGVGPLEPLDLAGDEPEIPRAARWRRSRPAGSRSEGARPRCRSPTGRCRRGPRSTATSRASPRSRSPTCSTQVDGRTVGTADGEVTLETKIATSEAEQRVTVRFTDLGPFDRVLHAAASPTWIYVLLVLGLAALAFEATQPGFGFAGFSGVGMLALAVVRAHGRAVLPARARSAPRGDRPADARRPSAQARTALGRRDARVRRRVGAGLRGRRRRDRRLAVADRVVLGRRASCIGVSA